MNIHVRYQELRSVGECENAEAEASISADVSLDKTPELEENSNIDLVLARLSGKVFNAVQQQIQAARQVHGLKIGDEVIGQDRDERRIKVWTIEEITNKYIYCVRMIDDWMDGEKKPVAERHVFKHSDAEKATSKLKELAGLA